MAKKTNYGLGVALFIGACLAIGMVNAMNSAGKKNAFENQVRASAVRQLGSEPDQLTVIKVPVSNITWACGTVGSTQFYMAEGATGLMTAANAPEDFPETWNVNCTR